MMNNTHLTGDYVFGAVNERLIRNFPVARHDATIRSLVLSELIGIWQRDELPFETVLDKIEVMDESGWGPTLHWLGHFYTWESFGEKWELQSTE